MAIPNNQDIITTDQELYTIHNIDARKISQVIKNQIVTSTITSPPYFDLKDYGHSDQIGYGQSYDRYLNDLKDVFSNVYEITKANGSLWIVIDTFRRDNEVIPLPFDLANKLKEIGWKLKDIIIWHKDKTVPWTHNGQMRSSFEYILFFTKTDDFIFNINKIRDFKNLKKWWVKYPERYNPEGKAPEEVWDFSIPTQGSWGNTYIKHFCPLPAAMVDQIIYLSSNEADVILDPFSGSGTVLAESAFLNRKYIGFELNNDYIKMFQEYLSSNFIKQNSLAQNKFNFDQTSFKDIILNLRSLKFARVLMKDNKKSIKRILVISLPDTPSEKNKLIKVKYIVQIIGDSDVVQILNSISKPPLSKFGIDPMFDFTGSEADFFKKLPKSTLYCYTAQNTWKYSCIYDHKNISTLKSIISPICVSLNESDYE